MIECRHCARVDVDAVPPSAALALVLEANKDLRSAVEELEAEGVLPCLTAVCPVCKRVSILVEDGGYAHVLALWKRVRPFL